jgi:hypothetical protein
MAAGIGLCPAKLFVILSEAKDLCIGPRNAWVLRFAQDDSLNLFLPFPGNFPPPNLWLTIVGWQT